MTMEKVLVNAAVITYVEPLSKICMLLYMSHYAEIEIVAGKDSCVQRLKGWHSLSLMPCSMEQRHLKTLQNIILLSMF